MVRISRSKAVARRRRFSALIVLPLPVTALVASASQPRLSVAGLSPVPTRDTVVNKVITTSFDLALTQPHRTELSSFIADLSNPASPNYRHFLTPAQYARRFGATASTVRAVRTLLHEVRPSRGPPQRRSQRAAPDGDDDTDRPRL